MHSTLIFIFIISNIFYTAKSGKILVSHPSLEMTDFRFGTGLPYVSFYERENFRGKIYHHILSRRHCTNLPEQFNDWASSIDTHRRCVSLCEQKDCMGKCATIYSNYAADQVNSNEWSNLNFRTKRLASLGLNDKVSSIKYCYLGRS